MSNIHICFSVDTHSVFRIHRSLLFLRAGKQSKKTSYMMQ